MPSLDFRAKPRIRIDQLRDFIAMRGHRVLDGDAGDREIADELLTRAEALGRDGGGTLHVPAGTYTCAERLVLTAPIRIVGAHRRRSIIDWASNTGVWVQPGAEGSVIEHVFLRGNRQRYLERVADTAVVLDARRRVPLAAWNSTGDDGNFPNSEADRGVHLVCIVAGRTAAGPLTSPPLVEGATIQDGTVTWAVEIDCGVVVHAAKTTVAHCTIAFFDDCGVLVYGDGNEFISDNAHVHHCDFAEFDGHAVYLSGSDGNMCAADHNTIIDCPRGCGVRDAGFLNSSHRGNVVVNARWPFVGAGNAARTLWLGNYFENCTTGIWIHGTHWWILGDQTIENGLSDARSRGKVSDGGDDNRLWLNFFPAPYHRYQGGGEGWDRWDRTGDISHYTDDWREADADDPGGYLRQAWNGIASFGLRDITSSRSNRGAAKWRFPRGYYVGNAWHTFCAHAPTSADGIIACGTTIWKPGDVVWNTDPSNGTPVLWTPTRRGGWGGARAYAPGHVWQANTGNISPGDALEPSAGNGHVYWCVGLEQKIGGVWVTARYDYSLTSTVEPTWPTDAGAEVLEYTTSTQRIRWREWGLVGMRWLKGPVLSDTEDT